MKGIDILKDMIQQALEQCNDIELLDLILKLLQSI